VKSSHETPENGSEKSLNGSGRVEVGFFKVRSGHETPENGSG